MRRDINNYGADRDDKEGLFTIPTATTGGKRNGPREYILDTIDAGHPLALRMNALVSRIVFEKDGDRLRATGVEYMRGERLYRADPNADGDGDKQGVTCHRASHRLLAASSQYHPQVLKLSGHRAARGLEALGIEVAIDTARGGHQPAGTLRGRRRGARARPTTSASSPTAPSASRRPGGGEDPCLTGRWREEGGGVYAQKRRGGGDSSRSRPELADPDLFVFGLPGDFRGYAPGYSTAVTESKRRFTWAVLKGHTQNTAGSVKLASTDPRDVPDIRFRYFDEGSVDQGQDAHDVGAVVAGVKLFREISAATRKVLWWGAFDEVFPGAEVESDEDLEGFVKQEAWGTTPRDLQDRARRRTMAVLDSKFRVRAPEPERRGCLVVPEDPRLFIVTSDLHDPRGDRRSHAEIGEERSSRRPTVRGQCRTVGDDTASMFQPETFQSAETSPERTCRSGPASAHCFAVCRARTWYRQVTGWRGKLREISDVIQLSAFHTSMA